MAGQSNAAAQRSTPSLFLSSFATILPQLLSVQWRNLVNEEVPKPYLDEVFHVRQAQHYCDGNLHIWDDKITTPPGLYLVSYLWSQATGQCSINALRAVNGTAIAFVAALAGFIISQVNPGSYSPTIRAHTACNIALFPPLFFFSALYYTDVLSTLLVLAHYSWTLRCIHYKTFGIVYTFVSISLGIIALWFRQTNIFWIAIFPAGLSVVYGLSSAGTAPLPGQPLNIQFSDYLPGGKHAGSIHNPPTADAYLEDFVKLAFSAVFAVLSNPFRAAQVLAPHLVVLTAFATFVLWNGGVVLGDKSNHVATIHTPQMLYIWPYIVFFSLPLAAVYAVQTIADGALLRRLPRAIVIIAAALIGLAAVNYNTIVHPFTLADNRHYVFYVFRILMRHPSVKYLAVPVYIACAWISLQLLGTWGAPLNGDVTARQRSSKEKDTEFQIQRQSSRRIGFVLVWLAATTLSIVTAPLVEPRYFIIPWAIWRLNVALPAALSLGKEGTDVRHFTTAQLHAILALETIWMLSINAVTGYLFIRKGFTWPQEPGSVQRFMW